MPAPSPRFEAPTFEPLFVESLTSYVTLKCRAYRVRREDVFDVAQEALTTIYASVRMFRPEKGSFDAWARGVAMNVIRRHSRDAKRYGDRFSEYYPNVHDYAAHEPSPERCAQRTQARDAISNALENLTAQQASIVVSFDVDDMSHAEIGEEVGISAAASQQCHQRAHKRLARCIDKDLLSVMPPSLASCDDLPVNKAESSWFERSHYVGQIAALLMAVFCVSSLNSPTINESTVMENRVLDQMQAVVMYRLDQLPVHHDAPSVKPEPASLPSVPVVSVPTRISDKRTLVHDLAPLPPYKHVPRSDDHHLRGR
jgi:RNA polymerase sigma factor (sigma-70 family)